jgi:hypothetical protein
MDFEELCWVCWFLSDANALLMDLIGFWQIFMDANGFLFESG